MRLNTLSKHNPNRFSSTFTNRLSIIITFKMDNLNIIDHPNSIKNRDNN